MSGHRHPRLRTPPARLPAGGSCGAVRGVPGGPFPPAQPFPAMQDPSGPTSWCPALQGAGSLPAPARAWPQWFRVLEDASGHCWHPLCRAGDAGDLDEGTSSAIASFPPQTRSGGSGRSLRHEGECGLSCVCKMFLFPLMLLRFPGAELGHTSLQLPTRGTHCSFPLQ